MGKLDLKLLEGIGEAEGLIQKERQQDVRTPGSEEGKKEVPGKYSGIEREVPEKPIISRQTKGQELQETKGKDEGQRKASEKRVFSFRAQISDINMWKSYATATGETMERIGKKAMNEYISRHKLADARLAVFEALMDRDKGI